MLNMSVCPVCKKTFKNEMAMQGHIRLSGDLAHEQYRGFRRPGRTKGSSGRKTTHKPVRSDTSSSLQKQVLALKDEIQALKDQPVQQQQQSVTTVKQFLDEEKQKNADLKEQEELLELMKEQMDGSVRGDHAVLDRAPESIKRELWEYHLSFIG